VKLKEMFNVIEIGSYLQILQIHMEIHSAERKYLCNHCGMSFKQRRYIDKLMVKACLISSASNQRTSVTPHSQGSSKAQLDPQGPHDNSSSQMCTVP